MPALVAATGDAVRLVRVRAAAALAGVPTNVLSDADRGRVQAATEELETGLMSRRDDWVNHYNLANLRMSRGDTRGAISAYETAIRLRPDAVLPLVNVAMAYAGIGRQADARRVLKQALEAEPKNAVAHFNMGLLEAELGERQASERHLRSALELDPTMAQAAYNLAMLLPDKRQREAQKLLRQAVDLAPQDPRYAYALAFHLQQHGAADEAVERLVGVVEHHPQYGDAYLLLGDLLERRGESRAAQALYARGASQQGIPAPVRQQLAAKAHAAGR
jgi:tetratricopeptide (TPR) repeat protein